jgi:hypothetical protein
MKKNSIIKFLIIFFSSLNPFLAKLSYSDTTILPCSENIPSNVACLIKANSYKIEISRLDICQDNPFPKNRSSADYGGARCVNLFDSKRNTNKINLNNSSRFLIPTKDYGFSQEGTYKYVSLILKNQFKASGSFKVGNTKWNTGKKGPKDISKGKNSNLKPLEFTERLNNWRGSKNQDNKYCINNGGTFSRCELSYNGYKLLAVGLGNDFIETFGGKISYLFYLSELSTPINIEKGEKRSFEIKYEKNLEVFGDGKKINSISMAPFIFKTRFQKLENK